MRSINSKLYGFTAIKMFLFLGIFSFILFSCNLFGPKELDIKNVDTEFTISGLSDSDTVYLEQKVNSETKIIEPSSDTGETFSFTNLPVQTQDQAAYEYVLVVESGNGVKSELERWLPVHSANPDNTNFTKKTLSVTGPTIFTDWEEPSLKYEGMDTVGFYQNISNGYNFVNFLPGDSSSISNGALFNDTNTNLSWDPNSEMGLNLLNIAETDTIQLTEETNISIKAIPNSSYRTERPLLIQWSASDNTITSTSTLYNSSNMPAKGSDLDTEVTLTALRPDHIGSSKGRVFMDLDENGIFSTNSDFNTQTVLLSNFGSEKFFFDSFDVTWNIQVTLPAFDTGVDHYFYLISETGETLESVTFTQGETVEVSFPAILEKSGYLYYFRDDTANAGPSPIDEPVVYLGSYELWKNQTINKNILELTGTVPDFIEGSENSITIETVYTEPDIKQWNEVLAEDIDNNSKALDFRVWVPSETPLTLSIRERSGTPVGLSDSTWIDNLGLPIRITNEKSYYSDSTIYSEISDNVEVLVLWDPEVNNSATVKNKLINVLDYANIQYTTINIANVDQINFTGYSAFIFATETVYNLDETQCNTIKGTVDANGKGALFAVRSYSGALTDLMGIETTADPWPGSTSTITDMTFTGNWMPGLDGITLPEPETTYSYQTHTLNTNPAADNPASVPEIIADSASRSPLAWRHSYGDGRVFYWNTDLTAYDKYRGFLLQSILDVLPVGAATIANAGMFHIDDYPNAPGTSSMHPTDTEYGVTNADFYSDYYLPDIFDIANNRDMELLFALPFNYNIRTTPEPDGTWPFNEWTLVNADNGDIYGVYQAERILNEGHELSLHGYNHRSLIGDSQNSEDTNYWLTDSTYTNMVSSVEAARERWLSDGLGPLPETYIAPHNKIDSTGLSALHAGFPELSIFCSDITISFELGGRTDFGPDPVNPNFFSIPRWTSGHYETDSTKLSAISELGLFGVWSHFVHPDDIYNNPTRYPDTDKKWLRNPDDLPWGGTGSSEGHGLYDELTGLFDWAGAGDDPSTADSAYPWLDWISTVQAADRIKRTLNTPVHFKHDATAGELRATFEGEPGYLWIRLSGGKTLDTAALDGATIVWDGSSHISAGNGGASTDYIYYVLEGTSNTVTIPYQ